MAEAKKLTKVIFVAGVMQGYLSGHYAGARDYALNLIKKHPSDTEALFKKGINLRDVFPDSPKFSKPFGYYVDQINSFYIAHQSYSDITVSFLMGDVLADGSEYTFDSWIDYLEELGVIKERR